MQKWFDESKAIFAKEKMYSFGVIVDMRSLAPLPANSQKIMVEGQQLYKEAGMKRSAVILASMIITLQFKRLGEESGIYATERYIDAASTPGFMDVAARWVNDGIDPDK